jgi:hypothetical protein
LAAAGAGENFFTWIKSRNPAPGLRWSKKFTAYIQAVKSGGKRFGGGSVSGWHRRC